MSEALDPERNPWKRLSRRVAYENPWIRVFDDQVLRPDGQPGIYGVVHYRNRAVGVVALDAQDRVLLVYSWEIPEGGAAEHEEPLAAAQRELEEETGCSAREWQLLCRAHLSNSVSDEEAFCYVATGLMLGKPQPEGTEELQTRWVELAEAVAMAGDGRITDALSIVGIQRLALERRRQAP